ncbi:hypothetical protein SS50377_27684 [Spironucleus salmonicida]|uniref:Uncharacterized protein n=1 Tax=Spironucleus salmonicida TaxID=348837 RepID=V6LPK1_9EUKA|nr:hypothetical protein SS50377_27684 [Spironucleus salmonicida]|eukprot:EST46540.1 hypothetical protein SS50377_13345 [Spironucleus salmonicida]
MSHQSFQVPPIFLDSDFQVLQQHSQQEQLHVVKIPVSQTSIDMPLVSPDTIKSLISCTNSNTITLQTVFGVQDHVSLQQIRLNILQTIKQRGFDGIRAISRVQLQQFLDSNHQFDVQLRNSIKDYLTRPIDKECIEAQFDSNPQSNSTFSTLNLLQKIKEQCQDQQPRGTKRFYTKKLISFLLGDGRNPYLGRMIFSQIGNKMTDYHRLQLNNSFAHFHVTKGSENPIFNEELTEEMQNSHLYGFNGRSVVIEHIEPFTLGLQLPGMAMKPSFLGHTQNLNTFKEIVESKFYNKGKNPFTFPFIPQSNLINSYESLENLKYQLKTLFVSEELDHAVPVLELCHGIAPFSSYQQQNRFLLTRNRNSAITRNPAQKIESKLKLNSSQFTLRELPLAFTVGQFIPTKHFDMKQADSKQAKTSLQQSQQDPKMVLAEMYRRERSAQFYYRIVQVQEDKKVIDAVASEIFPRENKNKDYLKIESNRVVYNGLDENNKIEELTKHMLIYENQIATCQYVQQFWDKTKAINYFHQIFQAYNRYSNKKTVEEKYSHVWFMLDRFLGWMNLSQSLICNNRLAKYYWISTYQTPDQSQHVILQHNTFKSFAPSQVYQKCQQIDSSIIKQLKFSSVTSQNYTSNYKKVEDYGRQDSISLRDPFENNICFNVNAQRIQVCHKYNLIGQTFMHTMTQEQQRGVQNWQARYDQAFKKLESIDLFTQEARQSVTQLNYQKRRKNIQNQDSYVETHLNCLYVDVKQLKTAFMKMQQTNCHPNQLDNAEMNVFVENSELRKLVPTVIKKVMERGNEQSRSLSNNEYYDVLFAAGQKIVHSINEFIKCNGQKGPIVKRYISDNLNQMEKAMKFFSESGDSFNLMSHDIFTVQIDKLLSKDLSNLEPIKGYKSTQNTTNFKQEGKVINEQIFINYDALQTMQKQSVSRDIHLSQEYNEAMYELGRFLKIKKVSEREQIEFQIFFSNGFEVLINDKNCFDDASQFIKQQKDVKEFINEFQKLDDKAKNYCNQTYKYAVSNRFVSPPICGNQNCNFKFNQTIDQDVYYVNLQQSYLNNIEFHDGYSLITFDKPISEMGSFVNSQQKAYLLTMNSKSKAAALNQNLDWATAYQHDLDIIEQFPVKIDLDQFLNSRKKFTEQIKNIQLYNNQISLVSEFIKSVPITQAQLFDKQLVLTEKFFDFDGGILQQGISQFYTRMTQQFYDIYAKINDGKRPDFLDDIQKLLNNKQNLSIRYILIKQVVHLLKLVLKQSLYVMEPWTLDDIKSEKNLRLLYRKEAVEVDGRCFGTRSFWGSVLYLMDELRAWNARSDEENVYYFGLRAGDLLAAHESQERGLLTVQLVRQEQIQSTQILEEDIFESECRRKGFL